MKTNMELVEFAKKALAENWGYCLGSFGNVLTTTFLTQKLNQGYGVGAYNTKHRPYLNRFLNRRVTDCYGLVKGCVWWNGGNVKYVASQDRNQEGAYNSAKEKGPLSTMPEIPGLILWHKGHAGIYIGNGEFIECSGAPVGMRKGRIQGGKVISGSKFTHWFKDTYIAYSEPIKVDKMLSGIKVKVKGKPLVVQGILRDGTNYVPIRFLEQLGHKVDWEPVTKTVMIK